MAPEIKNTPLNTFMHYLMKEKIMHKKRLADYINLAKKQNQSFIYYLASHHILSSHVLTQTLSQCFQLPVIDLFSHAIQPHVLPIRFIEKNYVLPLKQDQHNIKIAVLDPTHTALIETIQFQTHRCVQITLARYDQLKKTIHELATHHDTQALRTLKTLPAQVDQTMLAQETQEPITRFINTLLLRAIDQCASDIHFEIYENTYRVRFRQDGLLYETAKPPHNSMRQLVSRLKVMAKLNITEKRLPQDGHFKFSISAQDAMDIRVSTCPTLYGEKVVLRLLNEKNQSRTIDQLGFNEQQKNLFLNALRKPQGLILVTGPTGSGKTVTLYAALKQLNVIEKNILTVEDPAEIHLPGINQVSIHPKIGLTFPIVLRAFLRQDPDILMVGEIRDAETANIAIKAARTGHLVLATLHTNSAFDAPARLIQMGIKPHELLDALILVTAQRLVRKLCPHCKISSAPTPAVLTQFDWPPETKLFKAHHCDQCIKGYWGRMALHEILPITADNQNLLLQKNSAHLLKAYTQKNNHLNLKQVAWQTVAQGLTSLEEMSRNISDDEA